MVTCHHRRLLRSMGLYDTAYHLYEALSLRLADARRRGRLRLFIYADVADEHK